MQKENNPLLCEWNTPYQTPPFHLIKNEHYRPAIRAAIKEAAMNFDNIAKKTEEANFENTIVAMEVASEKLDRIVNLMFNLNECETNGKLQQVVIEMSPELARYENSVSMNEKLFARVREVYDKRNLLNLNEEQLRLLNKTYKNFIRRGALLKGADKENFAKNAEELSTLRQKFSKNVLADENNYILHITDREDLSGLQENDMALAKEEAESRNMKGWVFTLQAPSYRSFLVYSDKRELRKQIYKAYSSRGNRGGDTDNKEVVKRMVQLRYEQAKILGFKTYAEYKISENMAGTPEKVNDFLKKLLDVLKPAAAKDFEEVQKYAENHGFEGKLQAWDYPYYAKKLELEKFNFDPEILRPYFQLEKVRQGIFNLYAMLYGLTFRESQKIETYNADVKAYEIMDGECFMGVLYMDMFPRASKRSGAWMTEFRLQSGLEQRRAAGTDRPLVQVVCNFSKPVGDKPSLLSFSEVETFMHECGHAIHGLLSNVTYEALSSYDVLLDFVEMPSQIMENWCYEPEFLNTFAKHYVTNENLPEKYLSKIRESETYQAGYLFLRQLNFGLLDMAYHTLTTALEGDIEDFEKKCTINLIPHLSGCSISTAFTHLFSGGYSAGYYVYKWAEVLAADMFTRFRENGIFDKKTADSFREVLSKGNTVHPSVLFRNFMGREPDQQALMEKCGIIHKC